MGGNGWAGVSVLDRMANQFTIDDVGRQPRRKP